MPIEPLDIPGYLTVEQTAVRLGIAPGHVRRLVGSGQLTARRAGSRTLYIEIASADRWAALPQSGSGWRRGLSRKSEPADVAPAPPDPDTPTAGGEDTR